jgi:hypothetical protein
MNLAGKSGSMGALLPKRLLSCPQGSGQPELIARAGPLPEDVELSVGATLESWEQGGLSRPPGFESHVLPFRGTTA